MTQGEALVLADPGPWLASGMTGGVIYLRLAPRLGLTRDYLQSRISAGAHVVLANLDAGDAPRVRNLTEEACRALETRGSPTGLKVLRRLAGDPEHHFLKVVPQAEQTDQQISTE
jgi:glutamate synthase (NADPH/NADH) large chain